MMNILMVTLKCILPILWRKLIIYNHIMCNSTIMSAPEHEDGYSGLWYGCTTRFTTTNLLSHTMFSKCLELTFVWHVWLPFTNISTHRYCWHNTMCLYKRMIIYRVIYLAKSSHVKPSRMFWISYGRQYHQ